jgi:RimJ/RimL family protein N-acetyltransferase
MHKGQHIVLSPLTEADLPILYDWINDRSQVLFNTGYKPISAVAHLEWFRSIQGRRDLYVLGIRLNDTGELIGSCQLKGIHPVYRIAELQCRIGRADQRGKGLGTEAVRLLLDFAFRDLNLQRVFLHVFATNERAIRAYEKAAFMREGVMRRAAYLDGQYVDVLIMGILREEHLRGEEHAQV